MFKDNSRNYWGIDTGQTMQRNKGALPKIAELDARMALIAGGGCNTSGG